MTLAGRKRLYTTITVAGLVLAFCVGYVLPLDRRLTTFDPWQTGDWLIDFSAGPVRRGLLGEAIFFFVSDGSSAVIVATLLQTSLALLLFLFVGALYLQSDRTPAWIMLVLSPAFLLFLPLDTLANARKELIALTALAGAAYSYRLGRANVGLWLAFPLFLAGVFSHEGLIVTAPAFAFLIWTAIPRRGAWPLLIAYGAATLGSLFLAVLRPGGASAVGTICESWTSRGIDDCSGSLSTLGVPLEVMTNHLWNELFPTYWIYLFPAGLAVIPLFAVRFLPRQWKVSLLVVAACAPLFFIAWDYGRWLFLITSQLSLLALARSKDLRPLRVPLYGAGLFVLVWGMDHWAEPIRHGVFVRFLNLFVS